MAACDAAGRRDLALFLVDAGARLLSAPLPVEAWIGGLELRGTLSERTAARRAAGSLLRALLRWRAWDEHHRGVRFIDDGYEAAQFLLGRYERLGARVGHAEVILRELEQLGAALTQEPQS
jgi:hypothetical protein